MRELKRNPKKITGQAGIMEDARYPDGTSVAAVGIRNDFGIGVPSRPFLRHFVKTDSPNWDKFLARKIVYFGYNMELAAHAFGDYLENGIKWSIFDWSEPANAPETVKAKGFNNPLIDTQQMIKSITYSIEVK